MRAAFLNFKMEDGSARKFNDDNEKNLTKKRAGEMAQERILRYLLMHFNCSCDR